GSPSESPTTNPAYTYHISYPTPSSDSSNPPVVFDTLTTRLKHAEISKDSEENSAQVNVKPSRSGTSISSNDTTVPTGRSCGPATTDPSTGSAKAAPTAAPPTPHDATTVKTVSPGK